MPLSVACTTSVQGSPLSSASTVSVKSTTPVELTIVKREAQLDGWILKIS